MKRTGFTLIEVLVALSLGVMLVVAVQALVVNAYRVSQTIDKQNEIQESQRAALDLLEADLRSQPAGGGVQLQDGVLWFATLNAQNSASLAARHTVNVRYALGEAGAIERQEAELTHKIQDATRVTLSPQMARFKVSVFDGQTWHTNWPPPMNRTAQALRCELEFRDGPSVTRVIPLVPLTWKH